MSADTSNFSHIKDEDVLRKMWQDTDDFGKKKEIRSHMYKLREQRLREFYNGGEITESRKTTTSGKVTHDSTHADSLVDQSFQSLKSKEVRDSESPTRDIHYKSPDKMASKEWQVETNNETSLDGKTKIHSSAAALQGTQKIDGGQIDFKAKTEKMASVYRDANENSSTTRSQSSSSSHLVTSSNTQHNLPSNTQGVTKVIRETKSLPDGSTVTTTRYDTTGGTSLIASQSSTSNRQVNENIMIELPGGVQEVTKVIKETKTLPYGSTETSTRYNTTTNRVINEQESNINIQNQRDLSNQGITKITKETKTSPVNSTFTITKYDSVDDNKHTTIDDGKTIKISSSSRITSSKAAPEFPSDLQGVTKVTKETKTLPDGSIMTITKYDTATGTSTHSEIIGNVKMSKDHSSITNKSTKHTEEAVTVDNRHNYKKQDQSSITNKSTKHSEEAVTIDNRQQYRKQEDTLVDTVKNDQHYNIDNKITVVSTTEKSNNKDDRRIEESINVTKHTVDETDGNKISPSKIASTKITTNDVTATKQQNTNRFINTERQQEEVTRDKNIREVVSTEVYQKPREKESPKPENQPSKPTTGQYETTYRTDYTNRKISVDVSPTHDAFARSLRSVSPDRIPSRGNHRTSNSSIPEKMRHPSRISPDRQPKDRSISPTKSDTFKKTVSQETITISTSKQNITNKTTKKDVITTNDQYLTRSRTPSPKKLYKHEIVTDLDEDLNVTTVKPGSRPTSLELTRRPKKITDRSPSSPLTDLGSPNRSPVKEIRRSSSFRSPTKEVTSPTKPPKGISAKSPTKEVSTKNLPEDKPLKRTDTYEERCRQILGITEVTEKRKNSLERSSSKRNSLRRNMSSQFVDNTEIVTSPTKSPVKERPVSPTKSPVKERPANPTKSPVKERPKSPVKQRPVSPVKQKPVSPVKQRPVSPVKQRPASPTKSPSKQKPSTDLEDVEITKTAVTKEIIYNQKENDITEKQPLDISMETPRKTGPTKSNDTSPDKEESSTITTVRNETRISTTTKDGTVITDDNTTISRSKSTREPVETSKSPVKDTQKFVKENDTTIINKSDIINIEESVTIDDIKRETITKGTHPNDKISSQPNIISKQVPNNIKDSSSSTSKFILQEKLITDIHSSTEAIVDDNEVINITETEFNKIPVSNKTPDSIGHPKTIIKTTDKSTKTTEYTSPSKKEKVKTITKDTLDEVDNITQKSTTVTDTIIRNTKIHVSKDTKQKEPKEENYPVPTKTSSPSKPSKINRPEEKTDEETIIDEFVVEKDSDTPKIILGRPISEDIKPIKKNKDTSPKGVKTNTITKEDDTVVVTDEFEIVSNPNEKPTNKKPGLTEYPSQIKKPITKKASQDKIIPSKSKPIKEKPQLSEFPSQIKKDKKPARREPIATEKFFEPISYENKVPVEEPLMIKKNITPCIEDEVTKSIVQKTETVSKKPAQKEIPVVKQKVTSVKKIPKPSDKNIENPISRKPINGVSEYKNQYSRPKPTSIQKSPSNKIYSTTEVTTKTVFKPSDKINFVPTRPTTKTVVNGIHKPKQSPSLTVNSVKVTKTTDAVFKRTNKVITSKENEIPGQKLKKEPAGKVVIKKVSPVTKMQPSDQLTTKKHIVTTTITLKDNRQPKLITKTTKSERNRVTDLKQKHVNEYISTDTDEDEKIVETRETVDVTRRTINKKPEKKCITTKTVIINNNVGEKRQVIVDLQRSKSSREPTPDRICPVPINNGGFESPRYPDEIVEPDDDEIRRKPKRLSDIPLIESENVSNFSRITEITDSKVVTEVDKVEETDESLLSVNNKINLFLDNVDKVKKKHLGPAPKVERPKLEIDAGLESDECLLSVSEKVTKFVNAADQFINVHDVGERPKSPRCKFYNDKNTSETFITTEQKVSETQSTKVDTEKISLDNLNKIDTKSEVVKTTSVTGEMENRAPSPNKFKPTDKQEPKYPNYSTITKKVSLENLDIKNSIKSSKDVPENRGSKKRLSTEYVTTTTETRQTRSGSRDLSPEDTRYNRTSPDRKSPDLSNKSVTPTRRPSNDYGSTKTRKTEDISTSRDYSPDDDTATPKTSKTTEVEDKKTILSSTGRLRSTESIKKARAIFENIAKDQEPASPANKSPITKNKISKKLNYIGDKKNSPNLTETHPKSDETPHYMLSLDRRIDTHNQVTNITTTTSTTDSRTINTESNVSTRDSRPRTRSPIRSTTRPESPDTQYESSDVPHYMLPLDRSIHTNSHVTTSEIRDSRPRSQSPRDNSPRARAPDDPTKSAEVPHYMLPLDHTVHSHSNVKNTTVRESRSKVKYTGRDSPRNRSPEVHSETDEVPHYRLPLDRSEHTHNQYTTSTIRKNRSRTESPEDDTPRNRSPENRSQTGEVPHYMLPLDRSEQTQIQYTTSTVRQNRPRAESPENNTSRNRSPGISSETGEVPHYRLPLDRSEHTHNQFTTSTIRKNRRRTESPEDDTPRNRSPENRSQTGEVPHYRLPLDRSEQTQIQYTTSTVRQNRPRAESPENNTSRNRSPGISSETGEVPHYRLPLDRSEHTHNQFTTSTIRKNRRRTESPEDDTPRNRSPENRSQTGEVPHYRLPLDRSEQTQIQYTTSTVRQNRPRAESPKNNTPRNRSPGVSSETGDVPHYRLPLDRSEHTHNQFTTSTIRKNRPRTESPEDDTPRNRSPENRSQTGEVPHYRLPLDRSEQTQIQYTTSTVRKNRPRAESPKNNTPRNRSPGVSSETGDVPHYRLPLDRSEHTHNQFTTSTIRKNRPRTESPEDDTPRNRSPDVRSQTGEVPHYRLPLDRSEQTHSQNTTSTVRKNGPRAESPENNTPRNRSPGVSSETREVPHYRLPLERNVQAHSQYTTSTVRESRLRTKSPEDNNPRNKSPMTRSENGDVPHYRLPLDRSVHTHSHYTTSQTRESRHSDKSPEDDGPRNKSPMTRSEAGDVPHYRLPLDRSVHTYHYTTSTTKKSGPRTESPEDYTPRNRSPEVRSESGDIPHYRLPLDRSVHTHSHATTSPVRDSRPRSKSPGRDSPISRTPEGRDRAGDVPHYMLPLDKNTPSHVPHGVTSKAKVETRTTKFGITLKKVQPGSIASTPYKSTPNKPTSERKFSNIESITEKDIENIFEIEILEDLLEKIESYELRRVIRTQIRLVKKLISENTLTIYIKEKRLNSKQDNISRKSSYTRKYSDQSITTKTHSIQEDSVKTDTMSKRPTSQDTSPQRVVKITKKPEEGRKPSPERTGTREIITTTTTTTSRYSPTRQQVPNTTDSSYKTQSRTNYTITGTSEVPTEITRISSPERGTKTKVTETSTRTEQTRKLSTDKTSTTTVTKQATGDSVLKKTEIRQKKTEDDKPEWVKQRNLKKVSSTSTTEKNSTSIRKAVKEEKRTTSVASEPTDLITSSYGVGPTDENGSPLFGLKALRTQSNGTTKVQGTFVKSEYYSENGNEPVGQISVTKYSTDPRDLSTDEQIKNNDLVTSVTTTQQFGYDNTPSLEALTSKKGKQIEDSVTEVNRTSNFKRKNSVKALSQKFIDTAVESLKNERQTTYPKAGLILRTSSFKDSKNASSDEDISTDVMTATKTSKQTTKTTTTSGGTFLSNKSTVTGITDVISRMKTEEYQEGDSSEDIEAKSLLNKFIGSQVILSGMENRSLTTSKTSTSDVVPITSSARKTIKITTTVTEDGKTKTKTLVFQSPITEEELENIWDEQTLRLLLDQSTQYEERRVIRNRLRTVMAEQEACADLVEKASQDQPEGKIEGESLLLPLLQGLLEAPEKDQTTDSGTESGEDQRNGLITEVQNALDKLSQSLCSDSTDISQERRSSLLYLVTKLQAGLSTAIPKIERRLSSGPGKFNKRKNRQNRHTVGVSSEELADARRLMEEISGQKLTPSNSHKEDINVQKEMSETSVNVNHPISPKSNNIEATKLSKENSDSSVTSNPSINKYLNKSSVKNTTPKPFGSSNNSISNNSSTVQTPDISDLLDVFFSEETSTPQDKLLEEYTKPVILETEIENDEVDIKELSKPSGNKALQYNPVYTKPNNSLYCPQMDSFKEPSPRFNSEFKKQKMKRANTIDIPKPLHFYEETDDSDGETEAQQHKNNYYALRGPIRVGNPINKKPVPTFEPKTATDQKFLAFLNKNQSSDDTNNKSIAWTHQKNRAQVWENRFGNIKNNFENVSRVPNNTVKNFWKTQDDALMGRVNQYGPKISRQSARNLQQMFEEKKRESQERITPPPQVQRVSKEILPVKGEQDTITGKLTVKTEPQKNYKLVPSPLPVNKFSHAPQSAFKPIPKKPANLESPDLLKTEIKESDTSLFLYSPKPLHDSDSSSPAVSPVIAKPWLTNDIDKNSRAISIAAKKFEAGPLSNDVHLVKPRKLSKEITSAFISQTPKENLATSYVSRNDTKSSTVRKLSDQYNNLGSKTPEYSSHASVTYQPVNPFRNHHSFTAGSTNSYSKPRFPSGGSKEIKTSPWNQDNISTHNYKQQNNSENIPRSVYQHVPGKEDTFSSPQTPENVYTSTLTFSPNVETVKPPKLQTQLSNDSLHEYTAISSKVMGVPVSQQAVTIRQKSPMTRNEHDMAAAFSLKNTLSSIGKNDNRNSKTSPIINKSPELTKVAESFISKVSEAKTIFKNAPGTNETKAFGVVKPMQQKQASNIRPVAVKQPSMGPEYNNVKTTSAHNQQFVEFNEKGQGVVTSKFHIPIVNVEPNSPGIRSPGALSPISAKGISKSDSWHQICMASQSPTRSPPARNVVKSKSSHSLAVPQRQFEAGMSKDELLSKKKAMEAYLIAGSNLTKENVAKPIEKIVKTSINRIKTSEKQSAFKSTENVSVEKTTTQSPSATTTTVTKVTTQQQITKKPLSPFAKFRQLDKQNSINTPPGTPGTPKSPGNGPLFKFTDPAVSLSAATIKERLLFWCKMKTKEYENVQLDNFSTSWADGLAFCALIHHFLPDAFDYHALTPKERRHNFELAFRVASEKADIFPLLDVDDMMATRRPDWKCVFTYVQSVYRRFKDEEI